MADERINELIRQYKESGDIALRNQIAEKYLYIADILAKKFVGRGVEYDDLKQVAAFALLRGIDRFDPIWVCSLPLSSRPPLRGKSRIISAINPV